jgi:hypothetical protein
MESEKRFRPKYFKQILTRLGPGIFGNTGTAVKKAAKRKKSTIKKPANCLQRIAASSKHRWAVLREKVVYCEGCIIVYASTQIRVR